MDTWVRVAIGMAIIFVALGFASLRIKYLVELALRGRSDPSRFRDLFRRVNAHNVKVLGQKKLLKWSIPGIAHSFVMYAFLILATVYVEAYGILLSQNPKWAIPLIGRWDVIGFAQDTIAVLCLIEHLEPS